MQDASQHKVSNRITGAVCLLGAVNRFTKAEGRWETIILTCFFLAILIVIYFAAACIGQKAGKAVGFGGADIKLMAGVMLFLGWKEALEGLLIGLCAAAIYCLFKILFAAYKRRKDGKREIPLIPWLVGGICIMRLFVKL